ncbi:lipopolysaccharide biosynthesis protein [Spirochaeta dissipatitropha]
MIFIVIAETIINNGFAQAIIQKKEVNNNDLTTAFYFSLILAFILYIVIFSAADVISKFYFQTQLTSLIRVAGIVIILDAFVIIQRVQFERALNFKNLSVVSIIASFISGIIAVSIAISGLGAWALVVQMVLQKMIMVSILWVQSSWVPSGRWSKASFQELFNYGWKIQLSGVLDQGFKHIHAMVIGRLFAIDLVGYYTQAKRMKDLPMSNLSMIVSKVTFSAFSSIQDDLPRLKSGYKKSIQLLSLVSFPLMLGSLAAADRLIPLFLGGQWQQSIVFFQLLCLVGILYPIHSSNVNILKVTGRTDLLLKLEIIKKTITIILIIVGVKWGVYGLIISQIFSSYIGLFLNAGIAGPLINYKLREQIIDVLPILFVAIIMAVSVYVVNILTLQISDFFSLVIMFISGFSIYILELHIMQIKAWNQLSEILLKEFK